MSNGFFITGTDTDIGKTVAAAAILSILRTAGRDAVPMKPIQTGCGKRGDELVPEDLEFILKATGLTPPPEDIKRMCPVRLESACSPHLAAQRANETISFGQILTALHELVATHELVIGEGAGGLLVPLVAGLTMLDLMAEIGLPVILVARPGLGTLNHTLLSLRELERSRLAVRGTVLVETQPTTWGYIEEDNRKTIEELSGVPVLGHIPFIPDLADASDPKPFFTPDRLSDMPSAEKLLSPE